MTTTATATAAATTALLFVVFAAMVQCASAADGDGSHTSIESMYVDPAVAVIVHNNDTDPLWCTVTIEHVQNEYQTFASAPFEIDGGGASMPVEVPDPLNLIQGCNLVGARLQCQRERWLPTTNNPHIIEEHFVAFRVCKLSNDRILLPREIESAACSESHGHLGFHAWLGCVQAQVQKTCPVACCEGEQHYVVNPTCCVVHENRTEETGFLDRFDAISYTNSDSPDHTAPSADWSGQSWEEDAAFDDNAVGNIDDNAADAGRIQIRPHIDHNGGALHMQCGGNSCSLGCLLGEPMYIKRRFELPYCGGGGGGVTARIAMDYIYTAPADIAPDKLASLVIYRADNADIVYQSTLQPLPGGNAVSIDDTVTLLGIGAFTYIVEIRVPVLGCRAVAPVKLVVDVISIRTECNEVGQAFTAHVDVCGTCNGTVVDESVCDHGTCARALPFSPPLSLAISLSLFLSLPLARSLFPAPPPTTAITTAPAAAAASRRNGSRTPAQRVCDTHALLKKRTL
jgi:hypothetical protein